MTKRTGSMLRTALFAAAIVGLIVILAYAQDRREKGTYRAPTITAEQAMSIVKAALPKLTVGNSSVMTGRRGEKRLEVPLVLDGAIVSRVRLNPATGEILPVGLEIVEYTVSASPDQAVKIVQQALPNLEIASVSLGRQKGEWTVDLTLKKAVIAHIDVHAFNGSILPDRKGFHHHHGSPPRPHGGFERGRDATE
ncbi:MAG: hypothetical protein A4E57_03055 [Syntrophorhabdaceae bacterium PtaU1.Bin034]|nr:MAG: hypothetical protein A4E57_03055 [Syntrophorhabdaceae bacterium PtaU1.Bin034]